MFQCSYVSFHVTFTWRNKVAKKTTKIVGTFFPFFCCHLLIICQQKKFLNLFKKIILKIIVTFFSKIFFVPDHKIFLWSQKSFLSFFGKVFYFFKKWTFFLSIFENPKKLSNKKIGKLWLQPRGHPFSYVLLHNFRKMLQLQHHTAWQIQ